MARARSNGKVVTELFANFRLAARPRVFPQLREHSERSSKIALGLLPQLQAQALLIARAPDRRTLSRLLQVHAPVSAPMREFLEWVAFRPRSHADAMEAWGSHCPRFTQWEDALDEGLIHLHADGAVELTGAGLATLGR